MDEKGVRSCTEHDRAHKPQRRRAPLRQARDLERNASFRPSESERPTSQIREYRQRGRCLQGGEGEGFGNLGVVLAWSFG